MVTSDSSTTGAGVNVWPGVRCAGTAANNALLKARAMTFRRGVEEELDADSRVGHALRKYVIKIQRRRLNHSVLRTVLTADY